MKIKVANTSGEMGHIVYSTKKGKETAFIPPRYMGDIVVKGKIEKVSDNVEILERPEEKKEAKEVKKK